MRRFKLVFVGWLALVCCTPSFGQVTVSPYTFYGIGDMREASFANQFAMGDLGTGTPTVYHINSINPAFLTKNTLSTFQMGLIGDRRRLSSSTLSQTNGSANLNYFAYAFPIVSGKWTSSFGLQPLSRMNYNIGYTSTLPDSDTGVEYLFKGQGGISKVFFSNGVRLFKGFSLGMRASFIFGGFEKSTETLLIGLNPPSSYSTAFYEKKTYSDFEFGGGLHYQYKIGEKNFLHFGATYDLPSSIAGERFGRLERRAGGGGVIPGDTIINNQHIVFNLPKKVGFGVSFEKLNKFTVGFDARISEWIENPSPEVANTTYQKGLKLVLGGEITPDITSVDSYFARTTYRLGASWEKLPYLVNGNDVTDLGINFGTSLPMGAVSSFDIAARVGVRGSVESNLIRENYFQVFIGGTINDRWFIRRKYD